jgi:hypothetical protein
MGPLAFNWKNLAAEVAKAVLVGVASAIGVALGEAIAEKINPPDDDDEDEKS